MSEHYPEINLDTLADCLRSNEIDIGNITALNKFSDGQSNPTYKLETDKKTFVLRAQPPGELLKSAHQVDREFRVMKALKNTNVPVPEMVFLSRDNNPYGRMFFIMEHLDGQIFWDPALSELDKPEERGKVYAEMNKALAALHSVNPSEINLEDFGKPGNYFERQVSRWSKQYVASEVENYKNIHQLITWLEANQPEDDGQVSLVHGDYRLDNMIFSNDNLEILGVLDWELSTLGHPLADLAYQCMQWRLPNSGSFRGLGDLDRKALGIPTEDEYVTSYCKHRNIENIENWTFYVAFSFFRLAAILQGVYKRSLDGNASNPERARTYGAAVPILGSMAMNMIKEES